MASYEETLEGRTRLLVPAVSLRQAEPPTVPVFFNPAASVNRDVSVGVAAAAGGGTFCDPLCGTGARGIRVAREAGSTRVTLVDFNPPSVRLARRNVTLNRLSRRCSVLAREANTFLSSRFRRDEKFDFVDVDPFGTPAPYFQAAVNATKDGGILSFTATDTAVLCGVYPLVAKRRYGGLSLNGPGSHEVGIRLLLDACRRVAGSLDIGIAPVLAHSTRHYMRVFVRVRVGATKADDAMKNEGYITRCNTCGDLSVGPAPRAACVACGKKARNAGPLWTGPVTERGLLAGAKAECASRGFREAERTLVRLEGVDQFPPYGFSLEEVTSRLGVASVPDESVRGALAEKGFRTHGQPFERNGIKTDAPRHEVVEAVRRASGLA